MKQSARIIVNFLKEIIPLEVSKNNKKVYHSKTCPFCKYTSKKSYIFQYQTKLKVGKCYYCGKSFKELNWLIAQLKDNNHAERIRLTYKHDPFVRSEEHILMLLKKLDENPKGKTDVIDSGFVKYDLDTPF